MTTSEMRAEVIMRDGGCMAPFLDHSAGPCYDRWGVYWDAQPRCNEDWEIDYIRRDSVGPRHVLACDHVTLCPGHHRGTGPNRGYVWATAHRDELVEFLRPLREAQHEEGIPNREGPGRGEAERRAG